MKVRSDFLSNLALIVPSLPIKATSTKLSIGSKDALLSIQRYLDVLEGILKIKGSSSNLRFDDTPYARVTCILVLGKTHVMRNGKPDWQPYWTTLFHRWDLICTYKLGGFKIY